MPACVTRMMGPARGDTETASVHEKLLSLFEKAGYEVIYPEVPLRPSLRALPQEPSMVVTAVIAEPDPVTPPSRVPCCYSWALSTHHIPRSVP